MDECNDFAGRIVTLLSFIIAKPLLLWVSKIYYNISTHWNTMQALRMMS